MSERKPRSRGLPRFPANTFGFPTKHLAVCMDREKNRYVLLTMEAVGGNAVMAHAFHGQDGGKWKPIDINADLANAALRKARVKRARLCNA